MSLHFYLGGSGSGKSHALQERILELAQNNPRENFLFLVPEQFTMQTQKQLVEMSPRGGILNVDVLSFNRLAYRVFGEVGRGRETVIDDMGKALIVRRVATANRDRLKVLGRGLEKMGMVNEMKSLISELLQYDVTPQRLEEFAESGEGGRLLSGKLADVSLLYREFEEYKRERYVTSEELLDVLYRKLDQSRWLQGITIVLDGFTGFTPVQKRLVEKLLVLSKDTYVALTFSQDAKIHASHPSHSLFYMSSVAYGEVAAMAERSQVPIEKNVRLEGNRRAADPAMECLERNLFRTRKQPFVGIQDHVSLWIAKNPLFEVIFAANEIRRLVREERYRFGEIGVVTGDMSVYGTYVKQVFPKYGIHCFPDQKRSVLNNPATHFVRAAIRVTLENFSFSSVMTLLKNPFSGLGWEQADRFENYLLATGIHGEKRWREQFVLGTEDVSGEELQKFNQLRETLYGRLEPFVRLFGKSSTTVLEKSQALFELLTAFSLSTAIDARREELEQEGELALAREYAQIYPIILNVLDSLVHVLGDEKISPREYEKLLEAAFVEQKVGVIPPGGDEVVFGDIERSRLGDVRALFVLGANDGILPTKSQGTGLLSELDRRILEESGFVMAPGSREKYFNQRFYLYLNLTKPRERLYVCHSKTSAKGEALNASYVIPELLSIFPETKVRDVERLMDQGQLLECAASGLDYVISNMKRYPLLDPEAQKRYVEAYRYFEEKGCGERLEELWSASINRQTDEKLDELVARELFGDVLDGSVTRYELFSKCAYSHFLKYGLRLTPRREAGFFSVDFGNVIHGILERYFREAIDRGLDFKAGSLVDDELLEECVEAVITSYGNPSIYFTFRDKYRIQTITRIARRTLWALERQYAAGKFDPREVELTFKAFEELDGGENRGVFLRGKIDRVDVWETEENVYVKVVDYKTGMKDFRLLEVYYGTSLQLAIYMEEARRMLEASGTYGEKKVLPAGILYYRIQDPLITKDGAVEEKDILGKLNPDGLISDNAQVLSAFDRNVETETAAYASSYAPFELKKDGSLGARSKIIGEQEFEILGKYAMKKAAEVGGDILSGYVKARPALELDDRTCEFCDYHSVCGFRPEVQPIRDTPKLEESVILAKMSQALEDREPKTEETETGNEERKTEEGKTEATKKKANGTEEVT